MAPPSTGGRRFAVAVLLTASCWTASLSNDIVVCCLGWSPALVSRSAPPPPRGAALHRAGVSSAPLLAIGRCSFVPTKEATTMRCSSERRRRRGPRGAVRRDRRRDGETMTMLRNFDLPEVVVFYGTDSVLDTSTSSTSEGGAAAAPVPRPGVTRLLAECAQVGTVAILLSETRTLTQLEDLVSSAPDLAPFVSDGTLRLRSSLDVDATVFPPASLDDEPRLPFGRGGTGHAPSPAALVDAFLSIVIAPRGFGGSSGFGTKIEGPSQRPPLPQHVVVIVSGPNPPRSRARCSAARMAGTRVVYIETEGMGSCDAEELVDGVVETLGDDEAWDPVTLDGIATPGSYWLNPPSPRDDAGDRVDVGEAAEHFRQEREDEAERAVMRGEEDEASVAENDAEAEAEAEEMDEDEMTRILADLDSL